MSRQAWPVAGDVSAFLKASGATTEVIAALECYFQDAADAAIAEIERKTGIKFKADTSDSTRYYEPPTNGNSLPIHELSSLTSVIVQPQGGTATTLTENTDFTLYPLNYAALSEPIMSIEFIGWRWIGPIAHSLRRAVQVTGKFGRATTIPSDVWMAAQQSAGLWLWSNYQMIFTGGLESWREADVSETYGNSASSPWAQSVKAWEKSVAGVVARYRSPRIYF